MAAHTIAYTMHNVQTYLFLQSHLHHFASVAVQQPRTSGAKEKFMRQRWSHLRFISVVLLSLRRKRPIVKASPNPMACVNLRGCDAKYGWWRRCSA
ncbi:hypothetical protein N9L68_02905 [bacterium]|nr:hypothetical protein [bacterium]